MIYIYFYFVNPRYIYKGGKYDYNIPILYSRKQFIEVKDDINIYELKFKIYSYKNEPLILSTIGNFLPLENCEEKNEELKCLKFYQ